MKKTVVYTAPGCAYCLFLENFLKRNNMPYSMIDISKDKRAKERMMEISGQENVPVVEIGNTIVIGYDLKKMKEALGID